MVGLLLFNDQMQSWLSLPPDASWRLSGDHFRPHTSDLCAEHLHPARLLYAGHYSDVCALHRACDEEAETLGFWRPLLLASGHMHKSHTTAPALHEKHDAGGDQIKLGGHKRLAVHTFARMSLVRARRAAGRCGHGSQWRADGSSTPWCQLVHDGQACF